MESDLAIGAGAQTVPRVLQFPLNRFITVEFTIHNGPEASVFARNGLIAGFQVDDAEPRMSESHSPVGRDPMPLPVGAAMMKALGGTLDYRFRNRITTREESDDSAHPAALLFSLPQLGVDDFARRTHVPNRRTARACALTASSSRFLGGAFV